MVERRGTRPPRFRRRLTAAFIAVAAVSAGALAVVTYGVSDGYRWRSFERTSRDQVEVALALAPRRLDDDGFERWQTAYERRTGTDTVAEIGDRQYTTARRLTVADVPAEVRDDASGDLTTARVTREGQQYLVVGGDGPDGARYAFFFSVEQLRSSLAELRTILVVGWLAVVALAAAAGHLIARRTLRPVRQASEAATAIAGGLLETRLPATGDDEFRAWTDAFNDMADALGRTIEELRRTAERQRRLTTDVAHDLRTPLTGMAVSADLLAEQMDELPEPARRAAAVLVADVGRLRRLVLDLLELSRLDARADPVEAEDLDVAAALATVLAGLEVPDGVAVEVSVAEGLAVRAERSRLRRIVANLVGNAIAHGGGAVAVTARPAPGGTVVEVADDGPGIDPNDAERIFDRFYKSDLSRAQGGSGLGLAIAREQARAMGGEVTVGPRPGGGTTFALTLPAPADGQGALPVAPPPGGG